MYKDKGMGIEDNMKRDSFIRAGHTPKTMAVPMTPASEADCYERQRK